MSVTRVAAIAAAPSTAVTNTNAHSITTNRAVAAGNTIFIVVAQRLGGNFPVTAVSDNGGTGVTWTIEKTANVSTTGSVSILRGYCASGLPSGSVISITLGGATSRKWAAGIEVSGLPDAVATQTQSATASTGTPTTGTTGATTNADAIAIAGYAHFATIATAQGTPDTGYTEDGDLGVGASNFLQGYMQDKVLTATGTQSASFTPATDTTTNYVGAIATFEAPAGSTPKTGTTETPTGTDVSTEKASYPRTDSGSGSDASTEKASLPRTESGTGADASQHYYRATESGTGVDASTEKAAFPRTDTGVGSDASTLKVTLPRTDAATGSDASTQHAAYPSTDSGTGVGVSTRNVLYRQNFDTGQSSGTTISTGNSGGGTGNDALAATNGSPAYSNVQAHSGSLSMTPGTAAAAQVSYIFSDTDVWGRVYLYIPTTQTSGVRIIQGDGVTTTNLHRVALQASTGKINIIINGGTQVLSTNVIPTGQWVRLEYHMSVNGATAACEVKIFLSPEATSPDETISQSGSIADATIIKVRIGAGSAAATAFYFDDWAANNFAYPGPAFVNANKNTTESGTGSDVSTEHAAYPSTDSASGTDASKTTRNRTDSATGTDASTEKASLGRTETGSGSDSSSVSTGSTTPHGTDSATGADFSLEHASYPRTDSATGTESTRSFRNRSDSGTGTDASTVKVALPRTESGTGSDVKTEKAVLSRTETGSGADASSLNTGATVKHGTDSAISSDISISTSYPAVATEHLSSIVQGGDGTLWMGNAVGITNQHYIAKSTDDGSTWTWITPTSAINHVIWNTTRTWWLTGAFPDMNGKSFSVSQLKIDPVDPNTIYTAGRAGVWQSRDGGATWRPAMNGQDGSESNAFSIGTSGEAWATDTDYTASHTTDFWNQANRQTTGLPVFQTPTISRTIGGHTYVVSNSSPPATFKIDGGADKFNDFAKSACMNPKDIGVMSDGTILVALSGGVLVGRPSGSNYIWSKGGNSGGGYCNAIDVDPRGGAVTLAGDVWGFNASTDGGNNFYPTNYGQGTGSNVPYGRAVCYSQKNPDRCYVGVGTLVFAATTGGGYLGLISQSATHAPYQLDQLNSTVSFTTHLPTGNASDLPRPVGNLIAVDYDDVAGIEYLYCLTRQGLKMSVNDGVTLTDLGLPAPPDPSAWSAVCVLPNGDLLVSTFRVNGTNTGSTLYWVQNPRSGSPNIITVLGVPPVIEDICMVTLGGRQVTMLACGINGLMRINGTFNPVPPTIFAITGAEAGTGHEATTVLKAKLPRTESATATDVSQVFTGSRTPINPVPDTAHGVEASVRIAQPTILRDA